MLDRWFGENAAEKSSGQIQDPHHNCPLPAVTPHGVKHFDACVNKLAMHLWSSVLMSNG